MTPNLDEPAAGVVQSAFGFQGQKCSLVRERSLMRGFMIRCSRRIAAPAAKIKVGDPTNTSTTMSAVVNDKAFKSINAMSRRVKPKADAWWRAVARMVNKDSLSTRR